LSTYWNRLFKTPTADFCIALNPEKRKSLPSIVQEGYWVIETFFPNFPRTCPILPGKYYTNNQTIKIHGYINLPNNPVMDRFYYPNGRYKLELVFTTKDKSSTFNWAFIIEVHNGMNNDKM
jgi:hypothetical protein